MLWMNIIWTVSLKGCGFPLHLSIISEAAAAAAAEEGNENEGDANSDVETDDKSPTKAAAMSMQALRNKPSSKAATTEV